MDIAPEILIMIVALLILASVAWLELRYLRTRRQARMDISLAQDDAYNAIATTKAVSDSLRQQGRDTSEADVLLYQAESAFDRREFTNSKEIADRARTALRSSKVKEPLICPVLEPKTEEIPVEKLPTDVPSTATKKLPANYLESKFIIDTVRCLMEQAPMELKVSATPYLSEAQQLFDKEDYTGALRCAMRAKRCLEGGPSTTSSRVKSTETKPEATVLSKVEQEGNSCPSCGAGMGEEDQFCFSCGAKRAMVCSACSGEIKEGDKFCRKCGAKSA